MLCKIYTKKVSGMECRTSFFRIYIYICETNYGQKYKIIFGKAMFDIFFPKKFYQIYQQKGIIFLNSR